MPDENDDKLPIMLDDDDTASQGDDTGTPEGDIAADEGEEQGADYSEEELAALSPEERAAVLGPEDGGDTDGDEGTVEAAAIVAPADAEVEAKAEAPVDEDIMRAEVDRVTDEAAEARRKVLQAYDDGDLTTSELNAQMDEIDGQMKAAISSAREEVLYKQEVTAFRDEALRYLEQVPELKDEAHIAAYDRHVRAITGNPDMNRLTVRQKLEAAHRLYIAESSVLGRSVPSLPVAKKAEPTPPAKTMLTPKPDPVPTLARVPAAATTEVNGGRWAALQARFDAAGPAERERIMAGLSDNEREEFASADI